MTSTLLFIPIFVLCAFLFHQFHLLMTLLALEGLALSLILLIPMALTYSSFTLGSLSIIILLFSACEASLGLSLLVLMSRSYGSDMTSTLTLNKC